MQTRLPRARYGLTLLVIWSILASSSIPATTTARGANFGTAPSFTVPDPDHGLNATTFPRLWSGDADEYESVPGRTSLEAFLNVTDYPFTEPPAAVDRWNEGDIEDFPTTDQTESIYPSHARLADEEWIRDAYIEIFAITPNTVTHLESGDTRRYIRPNGSVLGVTDYRIELPPDERESYNPPAPDPGETVLLERVVTHRLINHSASNVTLEADGRTVSSTSPSSTPTLSFATLPNTTREVALSVTVSSTIEVTTRKKYRHAYRVCRTVGPSTSCHTAYDTYWTTDRVYPSRDVTVRDSAAVEVYELSPTAVEFTYVDGREVLAVNQSTGDPWAIYELPDGTVIHNVWHFYSVRDRQWDALVASTDAGTTRRDSDAIPLEVHAFPSLGGANIPRGQSTRLALAKTWGPNRQAPSLPPSITVPVALDTFQQTQAVAVASDGELPDGSTLEVRGLVRGAQATPAVIERSQQRASTLNLEVLAMNRSAGTATVRVRLEETGSGVPIDLRSRPGTIDIHGVVVETDATGEAEATVPARTRIVTARYFPGPWWATDPAYAPKTDRVTLPAEWPRPIRVVNFGFTLLVVLSPLLLSIYLIDRLLGRGGLWPPWRGLQ